MNLLDAVLVVAALLFAVSGYRQGFVVGVLSFVGFLGGGILGARAAPGIAASDPLQGFPTALVGLAVVLLAASVGQVLATVLGATLRNRLTWSPARTVDALGGAAVSVVSLLLVAWLIGTAVASSPYRELSAQVRASQVLSTVDGVVPGEARRFFASFRRLVDQSGFPEVFDNPFSRPSLPPVDPPDPALAGSDVVRQVRPSVLKITGVAESCRRRIEGTGFVIAPERVMTNAHVVAGVDEPQVEVGDRQLDARVVLFDPGRDVAVLAVPGLDRPALPFAGPAEAGTGAVVVGYPQDGPFRADAARVQGSQTARGPDIYQERTVTREIYALRGRVLPGNSGGPLVDTSGRVLGVIFAAAADDETTGYALTAREVQSAVRDGTAATEPVDTRGCDEP